jgi:hypothetical protein
MKYHLETCETTVLGGFPIIVHYQPCPAEPDVGIQRLYAEVDHITTMKGEPCVWIERKMTPEDWEAVDEAAHEHMTTDYYDDPRY